MTVTVWPIATVTGAPAYSGRMLRQAQSVFLAGATSARPLGATSGVRPGTSTTTCTATSTTWTIGPHAGVMDVEVAAECGAYTYANDAAITGAMTAAHATLARVDILWMRVDDPPEDGTSVPAVVGGYTAGTAASTPAAPATPARCMVLGWVNVPASGGGSPTVTWVAPILVAPGVPNGAWTAYTPTFTNCVPTGPYTARYMLVGKTVTVMATISFTSFTAGGITLSLPVPAAATEDIAIIGAAFAQDTSAAAFYIGAGLITAGALTFISNGGQWSNVFPFAWAATDQIRFTVTYEAA